MNTVKIPDKCLQCGHPYKKKDADLLSEGENIYVFHITCAKCGTSVIINIAVGKDGVLSVATLTDAGKADLEKLREDKTITADDVIEAYLSLKK